MRNQFEIAIVINVYKEQFSLLEKMTLYHNLAVFKKRKVFFVGPNRLKRFLGELESEVPKARAVVVEDRYFDNTLKGNSRMMLSERFYQNFEEFDFILICHIDAFAFEDKLDYWASRQYASIGAPVYSLGRFRPGNNGGLSLRKVSSHLQVLDSIRVRYSRIRTLWSIEAGLLRKLFRVCRDGFLFNYKWKPLRPVLHEDIFWTEVAPADFPFYNVPDHKQNALFAFERRSDILFEENGRKYPMGVHGWWKYEKKFHFDLIRKYSPHCARLVACAEGSASESQIASFIKYLKSEFIQSRKSFWASHAEGCTSQVTT